MKIFFKIMLSVAACIVVALLAFKLSAETDNKDKVFEDLKAIYSQETSLNKEDAQYAKVSTKKGSLNMRKAMKSNSSIIYKIPNNSIIKVVEDEKEWLQVEYKNKNGYVKSEFIEFLSEEKFLPLTKDSEGAQILDLKRELLKLGYIKKEELNNSFDRALERALIRLQLSNDLNLSPNQASSKLQALIEWGLIDKGYPGFTNINTSKTSDLSIAIYCWDRGGTLYEQDSSVKVKIFCAAKASGGTPPYEITIRKAAEDTGINFAKEVTSPFYHIWNINTNQIYVYATVVDALGNTVTTQTEFKFMLPERYMGNG